MAVGISGAAAVVAWALPLKLNIVVAIAVAVVCCSPIDHRQQGDRWVKPMPSPLLTIACLTVVTVLTACFFFRTNPGACPAGRSGLQYAPIAALGAVVVPSGDEPGALIATWQDARFAVAAGCVWFMAGQARVLTIVTGMAVYLPLKLRALDGEKIMHSGLLRTMSISPRVSRKPCAKRAMQRISRATCPGLGVLDQ